MRLHHIALRVGDLSRAAGFYEDLGLKRFREQAGRAIWLRAGDVVLMLELTLAGEGPSHGSGHLIAFEVGDLGEWERRLEELKIPIDGRTEFTLYVRDPDGHRVGLSCYRFER